MKMEQKPTKGRGERGPFYFGLGVIGLILLLNHFSKSRKKQPDKPTDDQRPTQGLEPEPKKETEVIPSGSCASEPDAPPTPNGKNNPGDKWYNSKEKRDIVALFAAIITLIFFIP